MTRVEEDFRQLRAVAPEGLAEWVERRFLGRAPTSWWVAMFEMAESSVGPARRISTSERREGFELGLRAMMLAVDRADIRPAVGSYWLIRLAAITQRIDPPVSGLSATLSPDGTAQWALGHMPISREAAMELAAQRDAASPDAVGDFRAPIGRAIERGLEPSRDVSLLQEVEQVITALRWIVNAVQDDGLRTELYTWLDVEGLT